MVGEGSATESPVTVTTEIDVGASWQAKCVLTSPTGGESIEYLRIRLKTDPLPVPAP